MKSDVDLNSLLFAKVYNKNNVGMHFAIDVSRGEVIFVGKTESEVEKYITTSGYNDQYDLILYGKVPENYGIGL